ncbi:NAD(P)/FAD-dependent oxidoreductase [uncultured Agrobacterium sp.]|uniref:FAD-dependent oxidoreductase n=1 Tax=uncultured Agrobacterium sp. TaxID=157277 RepID=UPI0025EED6B6|nr:NAD(P)/FAD-dependent oxidoreductase [uncultured Agrobacterium sp.]
MSANVSPTLIVGAGPTGLSLAIALRQRGARVIIIDRQKQGANTSRAAVIHAQTLEVLERLGVTAKLLKEGIIVPRFRVRDRDRLLLDIDFGALPGRHPFTLMLPQDKTEAILRSRLQHLGVEVQWATELDTVVQQGDQLVAHLKSPTGNIDMPVSWIVGCDGLNSKVREAADIAFAGGTYAEDFVLADVEMSWPLARSEVDLFFAPQGLMVVAPLPHDRYRIVATASKPPQQPDMSFIQRLLDERAPPSEPGRINNVIWSSRFHVHHRLASSVVSGNFILCGDAAHVHSPAGGQGMNTGIQDAVSLADPLLHAMKGDRSQLLGWADARQKVARSVVRLTDRMTRVATLRSPTACTVRNGLLSRIGCIPSARNAIGRRIAGLDY